MPKPALLLRGRAIPHRCLPVATRLQGRTVTLYPPRPPQAQIVQYHPSITPSHAPPKPRSSSGTHVHSRVPDNLLSQPKNLEYLTGHVVPDGANIDSGSLPGCIASPQVMRARRTPPRGGSQLLQQLPHSPDHSPTVPDDIHRFSPEPSASSRSPAVLLTSTRPQKKTNPVIHLRTPLRPPRTSFTACLGNGQRSASQTSHSKGYKSPFSPAW